MLSFYQSEHESTPTQEVGAQSLPGLRLGCLLIATWQTWRAQTEFLPTRTSRSETRLTLDSHPPLLICFSERPTITNTHTHTLLLTPPLPPSLPPPPPTFLWRLYLSRREPKVTLSSLVYLSHQFFFFFQFGSVNPYKHCDLLWGLLGPLVSGGWQSCSSQT